jgi:PAS domain S-box-containing protein
MARPPKSPLRSSLDSRINLAFGLVLGILVVVAAASYRSAVRLQAAVRQVQLGYETRQELERLQRLLTEVETGQRGFVITGDSTFLEPAESATGQVEGSLARLRSVVSLDPERLRGVTVVESLALAKLSRAEHVITTRRLAGAEAAESLVRTGQGERLMDSLRAVLGELQRGEARGLTAADDETRRTVRVTVLILAGGLVLAFGVVPAAWFITRRENVRRARAEQRLREGGARLQAILDNTTSVIFVKDLDGRFTLVNRACEGLIGIPRQRLLGLTVYDFCPRHEADAYTANDRRVLASGVPVEFEEVLERPGGPRTFLSVKFPIRDDAGRLVALGGVSTDITMHKRAEVVLREGKEAAERASRFKDQFLSTMSHELRTPLNAVMGFSELLLDQRYGSLSERQRRYVGHIHAGGEHLLNLINDILDLSRIEAGRLHLAVEPIDLATAVETVLQGLRSLALRKSQLLAHTVAPGLTVRADPVRLKQVLTNLVGNAIKFTPQGGRITVLGQVAEGRGRIEVRDTGPGVSAEERRRIFDAFYRPASMDEGVEGTGLGLAIAQQLVQLQGGRLEVESQPGKGSCFYFDLPLATALPAPPSEVAAPRPGVILVVEDDPVAAQLITSQLGSAGYHAETCPLPAEAVGTAVSLQPALITLDLLMAQVDGLEILRALKSDPRTRDIPVVVVTILDDPREALALGADDFLVKPVERALLIGAVRRCLAASGAPIPEPTILVVEDDPPTREVLAEVLRTEGYRVHEAPDAGTAESRMADGLPHLVVLDLVLPDGSGLELLARWRRSARTADLPVFVVTAKDLSAEEEGQLRRQAELVLRKERDWQQGLVDQVRRILSQRAPEAS